MAEEMNYDDFLRFVDDLGQPLPYSQGTLLLLLDSLSILLAQWGSEPRTAEWFLHGLETVAKLRSSQTAGISSTPQEIERLVTHLDYRATAYQHERFYESGMSLPHCPLVPPCRFH